LLDVTNLLAPRQQSLLQCAHSEAFYVLPH